MYIKYTFLLSIVLFLNLKLYSQKNFISYDQVKVENISSIEESFNSRVYQSKMDSVESANDSIIRYGKLKNYVRPENKYFGKVDVVYFYLKSDVLVRRISYFWVNPDNAKLKDYNKQFDKTVKKISTDLNLFVGEQGKLTQITDNTVGDIPTELTQRKVTWNYGNAKITIIMIWSEKHGAYLNTEIKW
jgi:hypothetical protein